MRTDAVGVVIPLHDKARHIERCLESVLRQSHDNLVVTVVDDGSTDSSAERVERINDPRIRLLRTVNRGPGAARNTGLRVTHTEWLAFLDADDQWAPTFIRTTLNAADRFPHSVAVFTDIIRAVQPAARVRGTSGVIDDYFRARMRRRISLSSSTVLVRRSVFASIGGFREDTRYAEDSEAWFRLVCEGPVYFVNEALARIEMADPSTLTRTTRSQARAAGLQMLLDSHARHADAGRIPARFAHSVRRFMQHQRGRQALHLILAGQRAAGARALMRVPPGVHTWREYGQCALLLAKSVMLQQSP
jgi:glycosyltransferase involved in cell wall biosynthesis